MISPEVYYDDTSAINEANVIAVKRGIDAFVLLIFIWRGKLAEAPRPTSAANEQNERRRVSCRGAAAPSKLLCASVPSII